MDHDNTKMGTFQKRAIKTLARQSEQAHSYAAMKPTKTARKSPVKVTIHPNLLARASQLAAQRGMSLSELIEDLMRLELAAPTSRSLYAPLEAAEEAHAAERAESSDKPSTARRSSGTSKG